MLDSATNYECYKGLYSAFNSLNMFEIAHSLARQFGPEQWTLYKGMHLFSFADNHDVTRLYSILQDKQIFGPIRRTVLHAGHPLHLLRQRVGQKESIKGTRHCVPVLRSQRKMS